MKKIYLVLGIAASMMFSSCSDFLDREPSTELPANSAIKSTSDLQNAVNGIGYVLSGSLVGYDRMSYASEFTLFGDLRTNDFMAPFHRDRQMKSVNMFILLTEHILMQVIRFSIRHCQM